MCGIIGVFNKKNSLQLVENGLKAIENRGKDGQGFYSSGEYAMGHCLHAVVHAVKQPIQKKGVLIANCEIYNWDELRKKHALSAKNDAEVLALLMEKVGVEKALLELDGVYAFAYLQGKEVIRARDIIGVKPLWYSHADGFSFSSEKKALEKMGLMNPIELNPRKIIVYDIKTNKIIIKEREFFSITPEIHYAKKKILENLTRLVKDAISKRIPKRKFGLLFSGGIDSTLIALILKKLGCTFTCYTAALDNPHRKEAEDLIYAKKAAEELGLDLKIVTVKEEDVESYLKKIVPLIEDSNVVKVGVALPFYAASQEAKKDGCKVIFSGLGSEEIFAGYERHQKSLHINKECVSGLLKMYERDLYRDDVIMMNNNIELRLPFLDKKLVAYALTIPEKHKIKGGKTKVILREVARNLGLGKELSERKKKAAQYGSNFHKAIKKLAKKHDSMSAYLLQFYPRHNVKLGALVSSGKDSIYAMQVMMRQNYGISCMITLKSANTDSFMFHTPAIELVKLQAESMGIPLIEEKTKGEKEDELQDLKKALQKAKETYGIEGVVTGALFSNYQRDRIEKIADSLGLKIFAPLWHMNQETEMREIVHNGFEVIVTKIAADGLDESWLGRKIDESMITDLKKIHKKNKINIAFEGGEAETLVLHGPLFRKRIVIKKSEKVMENKYTGVLKIIKANLG